MFVCVSCFHFLVFLCFVVFGLCCTIFILPLYPPPQGRFGTQITRIKINHKPTDLALSLPTLDLCFDIASKVKKCRIPIDVVTFLGSQVSNLRGSGGSFGGPNGPQMGGDL